MSLDIQRSIQYQRKLNLDTTNHIFQNTFEELEKNYSNISNDVNFVKNTTNKQQQKTQMLAIEQDKIKADLNVKQDKLPIGNRGDELVQTKDNRLETRGKDNYILLSNPDLGVISFTKSEYVENRKVFTTTNLQMYPNKPEQGGVLTTDGNRIQWSNQNALVFDLPVYGDHLPTGQLYRDGDFVKIK